MEVEFSKRELELMLRKARQQLKALNKRRPIPFDEIAVCTKRVNTLKALLKNAK